MHHLHAEPTQLTQYRPTPMQIILRNCVWFLAVVCCGFLRFSGIVIHDDKPIAFYSCWKLRASLL